MNEPELRGEPEDWANELREAGWPNSWDVNPWVWAVSFRRV